MPYEKLIKEYPHLTLKEVTTLPKGLGGLYYDNVILLDKYRSNKEKNCLLAEELGHYHTTVGNIIDQSNISNRKQEKQARNWAYKRLIPLESIIEAYHAGVQTKYELAEYLNVTEAFLIDALNRYKEEYGVSKRVGRYTIFFDSLAILEMFD